MSQPPIPSHGPPGSSAPPARRSVPPPQQQQHLHSSNHNPHASQHYPMVYAGNHSRTSSQQGLRASSTSHLHNHHAHSHHHPSDLDHHQAVPLSAGHFDSIDWESKERELEEARARAAQMEKTMRWWSDCTANWREKWSKVRTERNKAREESKILRTKLEMSIKDCTSLRREKQAIENENEFLRSELERYQQDGATQLPPFKSRGRQESSPMQNLIDQTNRLGTPELVSAMSGGISSPVKSESLSTSSPPLSLSSLAMLSPRVRSSPTANSAMPALVGHEQSGDAYDLTGQGENDLHHYGAVPKQIRSPGADDAAVSDGRSSMTRRMQQYELTETVGDVMATETDDVEYLQQKLTHLKFRLEEATKTIQAEREEKASLHRATEAIQLELLDLKSRFDELKHSKKEVERQLLAIQDQHRQQVVSLQQDRKDEANTRETLDRRLADLRAELERLQAENAAEWGRRERVETERQALERDNKKLRTALADLQERLEKRNNSSLSAGGSIGSGLGDGQIDGTTKLMSLQEELDERNKELAELRHAHNKLKKALQDRSVELSHGLRRAEHSEAEVRRLRSRIDELKREVASAQDELDAATNNVRKLQRSNEELQGQIDSLQIQATHLQTRLRTSSNGSSFLLHRESLLQDTLSEDDGNEF